MHRRFLLCVVCLFCLTSSVYAQEMVPIQRPTSYDGWRQSGERVYQPQYQNPVFPQSYGYERERGQYERENFGFQPNRSYDLRNGTASPAYREPDVYHLHEHYWRQDAARHVSPSVPRPSGEGWYWNPQIGNWQREVRQTYYQCYPYF